MSFPIQYKIKRQSIYHCTTVVRRPFNAYNVAMVEVARFATQKQIEEAADRIESVVNEALVIP